MVCEGNAVSPVDAQRTVACKYARAGQIVARTANGVRQTYEYDKKGQLLAVKDADGNTLECYAYDKAGNMLKKTVGGKTTTFTFDDANQLVSSTTDGVTTFYSYDAAGRLVTEGNKTYRYGYLDKVLSVTDGDTKRTFTYHADGQLATANNERADANRSTVGRGDPTAPQSETFLWDGLALIRRGDEQFMNEPHIGGGNPVASSNGTSYFNDMLGTTIGAKKDGKYSAAALTAFGERLDNADGTSPAIRSLGEGWFTGKPYVEGLGHAFLMRNYRASLAKWQTADPLGYPDGWNNLAYVNNRVSYCFDFAGTWGADVHSTINAALAGRYGKIEWYDSEIDTVDELDDGSDAVDSLWNQVVGNEFEHGMRSAGQTVEQARTAWNNFMTSCVQKARALSDKGRKDKDAGAIEDALELLGKAVHALADSFAPPHAGFQEWNPPYWVAAPIPGVEDFWDYVGAHTSAETFAHYDVMRDSVNNAIINRFRADFLYIIKE